MFHECGNEPDKNDQRGFEMTIASDIQSDFESVIDQDFKKVITFDAQSVNCFKGMLSTEQIVATAGYQDRYRGSLYSLRSDWTTFPAMDDRVTVDGEALLVIGVHNSALDIYFRIDVTEKYG